MALVSVNSSLLETNNSFLVSRAQLATRAVSPLMSNASSNILLRYGGNGDGRPRRRRCRRRRRYQGEQGPFFVRKPRYKPPCLMRPHCFVLRRTQSWHFYYRGHTILHTADGVKDAQFNSTSLQHQPFYHQVLVAGV